MEVRFSTLAQLVVYFKSHPPRGHAVGYGRPPGRTPLPSDRAGELIIAWTDASGSNKRTFSDVHQLADFLKSEPAIAALWVTGRSKNIEAVECT